MNNNVDVVIKLLNANWIDTTVERVVTYTESDMYNSNNWKIKELVSYRANSYYEIFFSNGLYMCLWDYVKFESDDCKESALDRIKWDVVELFRNISFDDTVKSNFIKDEVVDKFC